MRIIHVLKDGREVNDLTGHVVKMEDAGSLYSMIRAINCKSEKEKRKLSENEIGSNDLKWRL